MNQTHIASAVLALFLLGLFAIWILRGHGPEVKVNIQTATGNSLPVLVNHDASKDIHKSDGSTLEGHRVTDGSTINIMTKPEHFITINVKCGPKTYTKNVSSSLTARQLKEQLVNTGVVAFSMDEFKLRKVINVDGAVNKTMLLNDALSLYHYGVQNEANLTVSGSYIRLNIVNTESKRSSRMFSRWSSLLELKKILASVHYFDFYMFVKRRNNIYRKLSTAHDIPLDHVLKDGDTIYLSKNDFFQSYCRLYFNGSEVGNFGFGGESVLSIKLRTQLLTGIPVRSISIMSQPPDTHQVAPGLSVNYYTQQVNVNVPGEASGSNSNSNTRHYIDYRYPDDRIFLGGSTCYIEIV